MEKELAAFQILVNRIIEFFVDYSFQVIGAVIILIAGIMLGKWVASLVDKICKKRELDITLSGFLASFCKILVIAFAVIMALSKFGITIAPFVAAIGAAAFGATYAIQGPLSNYGAGLTIILARPFVVGDTVNVAGVFGMVEEVKLAYTTLVTEDGVQITIPNKHIVGEISHNSGRHRIVEGGVGISYEDDPEKAISIITSSLKTFGQVASDPVPQIGIEGFGDSSVDIGYRYWVPTDRYFETLHAVNLKVFTDLKEGNITIPFPQREVAIISQA
jgi:small conductance mechanosensitive channel